jgi:hypothetical protein
MNKTDIKPICWKTEYCTENIKKTTNIGW